jgi:hypothetical protein
MDLMMDVNGHHLVGNVLLCDVAKTRSGKRPDQVGLPTASLNVAKPPVIIPAGMRDHFVSDFHRHYCEGRRHHIGIFRDLIVWEQLTAPKGAKLASKLDGDRLSSVDWNVQSSALDLRYRQRVPEEVNQVFKWYVGLHDRSPWA